MESGAIHRKASRSSSYVATARLNKPNTEIKLEDISLTGFEALSRTPVAK